MTIMFCFRCAKFEEIQERFKECDADCFDSDQPDHVNLRRLVEDGSWPVMGDHETSCQGYSSQLYMLNLRTFKWKRLPQRSKGRPLPVIRTSLIHHEDCLYTFGGISLTKLFTQNRQHFDSCRIWAWPSPYHKHQLASMRDPRK